MKRKFQLALPIWPACGVIGVLTIIHHEPVYPPIQIPPAAPMSIVNNVVAPEPVKPQVVKKPIKPKKAKCRPKCCR